MTREFDGVEAKEILEDLVLPLREGREVEKWRIIVRPLPQLFDSANPYDRPFQIIYKGKHQHTAGNLKDALTYFFELAKVVAPDVFTELASILDALEE